MFYITINANKPNRTAEKNKKYHADYARWVSWASTSDNKYTEHMQAIKTNRNYVLAGKQWDNREDLSNFLMDVNGMTTNRIKVEMNYLQILVNHHVGNATRLSMRAKCQSFSPMVKVRKEESLNETLMYFEVAKQSDPQFAETIKANKPIGDSEYDTAQKHDNYYCDRYVKAMNNLMLYSEAVNDFDSLKLEVAESMAITGMYITRPEPFSGDFRFRWVQSENFFFDRNARKYDLSDAGYMGECYDAMPTEIYERLNVNTDIIDGIEINNLAFKYNDRVTVYIAYWRDIELEKWGYVKNEFDDIVLARINHISDDEEKPRYTEKDVVNCSELTPYQLNVLKKTKKSGKGMKVLPTERWRYCEFIPAEQISFKRNPADECYDLVLAYGEVPYQEQDIYSAYNMKPPYKVAIYFYNNGYINSPMCVAISPQRMANRIMSAVENMLNNSRGSGTILSKEMVDKTDYTDAEIAIKMKRGEHLTLPTAMFGGVANAVGKYDSNLGEGSQYLLKMSEFALGLIENITGVNQAMKGQIASPDQLVGTMQLMIQRGSIIQERFTNVMQNLFKNMYQAVATSGKRLYINEKPKLNMIVGNEGAQVIELAKDMLMEDFRADVEFNIDKQTERQFVDGMLLQLIQYQLIDRERATSLMGRGSTEDMWSATRDYAKELAETEAKAAQAQQMQAQQQQAQQQQNYNAALQQEKNKTNSDVLQTIIKEQGKQQNNIE